MTIKAGITGGIGSGKTTVATLLRAMGYPVYNADENSKRLCCSDKHLQEQLKYNFGNNIYNTDNTLNKTAFATIIFGNAEKLRQANAIIHPVVVDDFCTWAATQNSVILFVESAILLQSSLMEAIDKIVLVSAPEDLRIRRVLEREGGKPETVLSRIYRQLSEEEMIKKADFIIYNDENRLIIPQTEEMLSVFLQ